MTKRTLPLLIAALAARVAFAFSGHAVTEGPLRLEIGPVRGVTEYDKPYEVPLTVANSGPGLLEVHLRVTGLADPWQAVGATEKTVSVPPGEERNASFSVRAGPGAYSALYPVHVHATFSQSGQGHAAHGVRIIETRFSQPPVAASSPTELPVTHLPPRARYC